MVDLADDFLHLRVGNKLLLGGFSYGLKFQFLLGDFDADLNVNWFDTAENWFATSPGEEVFILRTDGKGRELRIDFVAGRLCIINDFPPRKEAVTIPFSRDDYEVVLKGLLQRYYFLTDR